MGGIFAEAGGEPRSARNPDLRCLSTLGVGSEVDSDVREAVFTSGRVTRDSERKRPNVSATPF